MRAGAGSSRTLSVGSDLNANEQVRTGADSNAQLLFLDQTNLNVGPNSEVTLDRFVYDPNSGVGNVVLNASKGAFRFVSGSQKPASYLIKTPVATVGVRGSIGDLYVGDGFMVLINVTGSFHITLPNGTTVDLTKPGDAVVVKTDGSVQGPFTWDGTVRHVVSGLISFPLFGWTLFGDPKEIVWPDKKDLRAEELAAMGESAISAARLRRPAPPPPPPPFRLRHRHRHRPPPALRHRRHCRRPRRICGHHHHHHHHARHHEHGEKHLGHGKNHHEHDDGYGHHVTNNDSWSGKDKNKDKGKDHKSFGSWFGKEKDKGKDKDHKNFSSWSGKDKHDDKDHKNFSGWSGKDKDKDKDKGSGPVVTAFAVSPPPPPPAASATQRCQI